MVKRNRKTAGEEDDNLASQAEKRLSEGREELNQALGYMNKIKTEIAQWHGNTREFLEEVTDEYARNAEEMEDRGEIAPIGRAKALWNLLPTLIKKEDPTKKEFGKMLDNLVRDAGGIYEGLDGKLDAYGKKFDETDKLNEKLIDDSQRHLTAIEKFNTRKEELDNGLGSLNEKLSAPETIKGSKEYLTLRKEILNKKRDLEEVSKQRSMALTKYNSAINILEALDGFRDENQIMLSEGRKLHDTLQTNIDTLKPLFHNISSSASLVEFQREALGAYEMLKKTFNPAMIAITAVSKGVGKVASECIAEDFIEEGTINSVKALTEGHRKELDERTAQEDEVVKEVLGASKKEKEKVEVLTQDEDDVYTMSPDESEEEEIEEE
ncbi:MAG: hypothetical protein ISS23_01330 [Nanoarchaeota archaeon]|nr:hypothetical protein [Nanoarchaeota archaeon]